MFDTLNLTCTKNVVKSSSVYLRANSFGNDVT